MMGLGGLAVALVLVTMAGKPENHRLSVAAGVSGTTRALIVDALVAAATERGAVVRLVEVPDAKTEVDLVNDRSVDFALLSGSYRIPRHANLREVAPLYVEALHLGVKEEIAQAVARDFEALRGRVIDLGPAGSETEGLAATVLQFVEPSGDEGASSQPFVTRRFEPGQLQALVDAGDRRALPDAVFHLSVVPSRKVLPLVRDAGYRLVALPFANALRLNTLVDEASVAKHDVDPQYIVEAVVPRFTYSRDPAVPPETLETVGTRLLLLAHDQVPSDTVGVMLDAVFKSRFARLADPPLDHSVFALPPRLPLHAGTIAYLRRSQPFVTSERVGGMSSALSVIGSLVGSGLFFRQWRRQRAAARRDEVFGSYIFRTAAVERRVTALELAATLDAASLIELQQELLRIKTEALDRFAAGELGDHTTLSNLLEPLDTARGHIGELLLHVRENIEERAEAEGRTEQALWTEATRKP